MRPVELYCFNDSPCLGLEIQCPFKYHRKGLRNSESIIRAFEGKHDL